MNQLKYFYNKICQQIISTPSNAAFYLSNIDVVKNFYYYPKYLDSIQEYQNNLKPLTPLEWDLVCQLRERGVAITNLAALNISNTESFLDGANKVTNELNCLSTSPQHQYKDTLTANARQLLERPEILHWGSSNRLQRIVENYLELPVAYDGLSFYYSIANGKERGPRKWHRDKEDWKMIKVAVYLNPVDLDGGPLECVLPYANNQICQIVGNKYIATRSHKIRKMLNSDNDDWYTSCVGDAGTVVFIDTAKYYHRGRPPIKRDRAAVFFSYFSTRPKHPYFCGRSPLSEDQLAEVSRTWCESSRNSILWRRNLEGLERFIPKNRLKV